MRKEAIIFLIFFVLIGVVSAAPCENRYQITSSCECNGVTRTSGYCCYYNPAINNITWQTNQYCGYTKLSPHREHILTFKIDYRWSYYPGNRTAEIEEGSKRYDLMITGYHDEIKQINPNIKNLEYQLDLSFWRDSDPYGLNAYLANYAATNGYNIEDAYLHYSEPTSVTLNGVTINFPGCTQATRSPSCRMQTFSWNSYRYITNPKTNFAKNMFADWWLKAVTDLSPGSNTLDGVWMDEHPYMTLGSSGQTVLVSGGGIVEYSGLRYNDAAFGTQYYADINVFITAQKSKMSVGKIFWVNHAEWYNTPVALGQSAIADGSFWELTISPYQIYPWMLWDNAKNLYAQGKYVGFSTREKNPGATSYLNSDVQPYGSSPGNSANTAYRARLVELSMYYLGKDAANKWAYFEILGGWGAPYDYQWNYAQETDIGLPIGDYYTYKTGTDGRGNGYTIFARNFTKALVLLRPKGGWQAQYDFYDDTTIANVNLPQSLIQIDGNGQPITATNQIQLRNSEAAILLSSGSQSASSDVNSDGVVNIKDLSIVIFNQGRNAADPNYNHLDLNSDSSINWNDVQIVMISI